METALPSTQRLVRAARFGSRQGEECRAFASFNYQTDQTESN